MSIVIDEYKKIYASFDYNLVDSHSIQRHIEDIARFAAATDSMIAIYDNYLYKPVYMSDAYQRTFGADISNTHPDDFEEYMKYAVIALRYFFNGGSKRNISDYRLIRKYRMKINHEFKVVIEQLLPLEFDLLGNVWLSLILIEIAPCQSPPYKVESKIYNVKTGDIISPVDNYFDGKPILTKRELEILSLIEQGFLSKEISEKLSISINTVSKHRQRILEKLKVDTSIEAIKYASAMGLL